MWTTEIFIRWRQQKATILRGGCGRYVNDNESCCESIGGPTPKPRLALVGWHDAGRGDEMYPSHRIPSQLALTDK
jgi:hypothetical protein